MSDRLKNLKIDFSMDKINQSYPSHCLPAKLNKRSGKAKRCAFEEIRLNYENEAKMVAFYTNRALEILYYNNLGEEEELNVVWQDEPNRWTDPDSATNMIVIVLHTNMCRTDKNSLQYQLRFFITTGTIQVQGNNVSRFISEHFPKLKALVNIILRPSMFRGTTRKTSIRGWRGDPVQNSLLWRDPAKDNMLWRDSAQTSIL